MRIRLSVIMIRLNFSIVTVAIDSLGLLTALGPPITDESPIVEKAYAGSPF